MKIKLAILEKDSSYLNRIVTAFNTKYADKLEIYSFTDKNIALSTLNTIKIDVFIASELFEIDVKLIPKRCGFAYFVESPDVETIRDQQTICKFQKADLIYKQVLSIYSENAINMTGIRFDDASTKVISFVSVSGGVGSSTLAAACATYIAQKQKKVLYLNLEQFGNSELFFQGEGQFDFGDVIYAIKSKKSNLSLKLESTVRQDVSGVNYYAPSKIALDMSELSIEDLKRLIGEIKMSGSYEYIIIDADFALDNKTFLLWRESYYIVIVSDGSELSNSKFERGYNAIKVIEEQDETIGNNKMLLLYNKFSNKTGNTLCGLDVKELGGIPKFEGATTEQIIEQLASMSLFGKLINE